MKKQEFKDRLKALGISQADFFKMAQISASVGSNYKDEDDMPGVYEALIGMLEEINKLKKTPLDINTIPPLDFLMELNGKIEAYLKASQTV